MSPRHMSLLVSRDSLVDLNVFEKVGLLSKSLPTNLTFERFFSSMCSEVDLDIGFVEKSTVTDPATVDRLVFLTPNLNRHWKDRLFSFLHLLKVRSKWGDNELYSQ